MKSFTQFIRERVLYHGSPLKNLASIESQGLVPSIGTNKHAGEDDTPTHAAVHLTTSEKIAQWYAQGGFAADKSGTKGKGVVFAIDTTAPELEHATFSDDPHEENSVMCPDPIPPSAILSKRVVETFTHFTEDTKTKALSVIAGKGKDHPIAGFHHPVDTDYNLEYKDDFKKPKLQKVKISDLVPTQHTVTPSKVKQYFTKGHKEHPDILHPDSADGYQIADGHHRIMGAMARGEKHIMAHVWGQKHVTEAEEHDNFTWHQADTLKRMRADKHCGKSHCDRAEAAWKSGKAYDYKKDHEATPGFTGFGTPHKKYHKDLEMGNQHATEK